MLVGVLHAVCSDKASLEYEALGEGLDRDTSTPSNAHDVRLISTLKNVLVGNECAKEIALRLGIIEELLVILDSVEVEQERSRSGDEDACGGNDDCHGPRGFSQNVTLHAMGLFAILITSSAARDAFSTFGARIIRHITRAVQMPSEKVRSISLRALSAMCRSKIAPTEPSLVLTTLWEAPPLLEVAQLILKYIYKGTWTPALTTLGVDALALMTRDNEIARGLGPLVASTGVALLQPLLPSREPRNFGSAKVVKLMDARCARELTPLLELLFNLSSEDPSVITLWLIDSASQWSSWGALEGLEVNMNHRDEQVRVLAGLVLVNCEKGMRVAADREDTPSGRRPMPPPSPASLTSSDDMGDGTADGCDMDSGHGGAVDSCIPEALDAVIAHRVLQLFVRTLRSWAVLPIVPTVSPTEGSQIDSTTHSFAGAIARAIKSTTERGTRQRLRELVACGAIDALVAWLHRSRMIIVAGMGSNLPPACDGREQNDDILQMSSGSNGVSKHAVASALDTLAILCSDCEAARERVVAFRFHSSIDFWLGKVISNRKRASNGNRRSDERSRARVGDWGENDAVVCSMLRLVRNLGRSSMACAALATVGVHHSLIAHLLTRCEHKEDEGRAHGASSSSFAAAGLANLVLEHDIVKEAFAGSDCLQRMCDLALSAHADEKERVEALAILKSACFLAPRNVRVRVAGCLGGVQGMLGLIRASEATVVLKGLQMLRNLLHAVPLRDLVAATPASREACFRTTVCFRGDPKGHEGTSARDQAQSDVSTVGAEEGGNDGILVGGLRIIGAGGAGEWDSERRPASTGSLFPWNYWRDTAIREGQGIGNALDIRRPEPVAGGWLYPERMCSNGVGEGDRPGYATKLLMLEKWNPGLVSLVEEVVSRLEMTPAAGGCNETSSAALHLLYVLSAADNLQRIILQISRVLPAVIPFLLPEDARHHAAAVADRTSGIQTKISNRGYECGGGNLPATTGWNVHGAGVAGGARSILSPSWEETPPRISADAAARLLVGQLLPEHSGDVSGTFAFATSTSAAYNTVVAAAGTRTLSGRALAASISSRLSARTWRSRVDIDDMQAPGR